VVVLRRRSGGSRDKLMCVVLLPLLVPWLELPLPLPGELARAGNTSTIHNTSRPLPDMLRNTLRATMSSKLRAAIIVVSETASKDASTDKCIPALQEVFQQDGGDRWEPAQTRIVSDDVAAIREAIKAYTDGADSANLVVTSGGTGFAQKDVTPEVST